jgi:transposase
VVNTTTRKSDGRLPILNGDAAGIDIGAAEHWVAVPEDRDPQPVRKFGAFTEDLLAIAAWLKACGVKTVAMEATGVYWIALFQILEASGQEAVLVNAKHVRHVPGRKSDQRDCQWLRDLHSYGLLSGSFRPADDICVLRSYLRHRDTLVRQGAAQVQRMQKALIQMNVLLTNVLSDITGVTGMNIIKAILAGERDSIVLARFRNPHVKASSDEIARSLRGDYRREHLFALKQSLQAHEFFQGQIDECDRDIQRLLDSFEPKLPPDAEPPPNTSTHRKPQRNEPPTAFRAALYRILGTDLTQVPGLQTLSAVGLISEIGFDITRFRSEKAFACWTGLCPAPKVSGGRRLGEDPRHIHNRTAQILRMAASSLSKSQTALGAFYRRLRARIGPAKALKALAHKLARILYRLLRYGTAYVEAGQLSYEQRLRDKRLKSLARQATDLGFQLLPLSERPSVS